MDPCVMDHKLSYPQAPIQVLQAPHKVGVLCGGWGGRGREQKVHWGHGTALLTVLVPSPKAIQYDHSHGEKSCCEIQGPHVLH